MTSSTNTRAFLAHTELLGRANEAERWSPRVADLFLGNAQGGEADLDDYELRQMMAL